MDPLASSPRGGGPQPALDRQMLFSSLLAGALWLALSLFFTGWPLALVGAAYVVVASGLLAVMHGRAEPSRRREIAAWTVPWALAVGIWFWILAAIDGLGLVTAWAATVVATGAYAAWQVSSLALRQSLFRKPAAAPSQSSKPGRPPG